MQTNDFYEWCNENFTKYETLSDAMMAFNTERREEMERDRIPLDHAELMEYISKRQVSGVDLPAGEVHYDLDDLQDMFERSQWTNCNGHGYAQMK